MSTGQLRPTPHLAVGVMTVVGFACMQSLVCAANMGTAGRSPEDLVQPFISLLGRTLLQCLPLLCFFGLWGMGRFRSLERGQKGRFEAVWFVTFGLGVTLGLALQVTLRLLFDLRVSIVSASPYEHFLPTIAGLYVFRHGQLTGPPSTLSHEESLRALRAQLQPHFLFNTLHAIGVTAKQDPDAAQRMTTLLGDLLRAALVDRGGKLVSVSEELSLLQPYVQLQQVRFQDRLRLETDVPGRLLSAQVPDLLLQPLVENAIEHGIEQRPGAGLVRIVVRTEDGKLVVEVEDDGPGPAQEGEPKDVGTGLGATIQRIRLLFAAEAWLELRRNRHGGTTTQVKLPLEYVKAAG